jgi:hypothetical protein
MVKKVKLVWEGDFTTNRLYAIQREHARGESPAYQAWVTAEPASRGWKAISANWWHYKRDAKAECQEHFDAQQQEDKQDGRG